MFNTRNAVTHRTVLRAAKITISKVYGAIFDELIGAAVMAFFAHQYITGAVLTLVCVILQFAVSIIGERDRE